MRNQLDYINVRGEKKKKIFFKPYKLPGSLDERVIDSVLELEKKNSKEDENV